MIELAISVASFLFLVYVGFSILNFVAQALGLLGSAFPSAKPETALTEFELTQARIANAKAGDARRNA
jgi:hypothetical protein